MAIAEQSWTLNIVNGGAESGNTGWINKVNSVYSIIYPSTPPDGTRVWSWAGSSGSAVMVQYFNINNDSTNTAIDTGRVLADINFYETSLPFIPGNCVIRFSNSSGAELNVISTVTEWTDGWKKKYLFGIVPANTRNVAVEFHSAYGASAYLYRYIDSISDVRLSIANTTNVYRQQAEVVLDVEPATNINVTQQYAQALIDLDYASYPNVVQQYAEVVLDVDPAPINVYNLYVEVIANTVVYPINKTVSTTIVG